MKNPLFLGILVTVAYIAYVQRISTAVASIGIAAVLYGATLSLEVVLAFLILSILFTMYRKEEGFQVKDAPSIHTRLESVKVPPAPKIENITGVLESPNILDNTPLQGTLEGGPGASIPASAKDRVLIYPVAENFVPANTINDNAPMDPLLMNGRDEEAEEASLVNKGTDLNSMDLTGVTGEAPAF
jgi:hypothetical protein